MGYFNIRKRLFLGIVIGSVLIGFSNYYTNNINKIKEAEKDINEKKEKINRLEKYIYDNKEMTFLLNDEEKKISKEFINEIRKKNFKNIQDVEKIYIEPQHENKILVCGRDFAPGIWDIYHTRSDYKNDLYSFVKFDNNDWKTITRMKKPMFPRDSGYRDDFVNDKEFKIGDYIELTRISSWGLTLEREKEKEQLKN
ncbi:hypothetical protein [Clostridium thermobutyricum]|uniref:hypothetical protein n=1 Tax=Clostridium thermobutyricum TaxID=29372 RepID=UPI0018A9292A|nr:hypothetical protein [Clostridium thermobutyricum]